MMNNWNVKKLSEVCDFDGGSQPAKTFFSNVEKEGYIRLIQIRDYKSDKHIVYIPRDKAKRFCDEKDIMIGRYGPPVFQILSGLKGTYNVALMKAIPKKDKILRDYLFLFLKYSKIQEYIIHLSQRAAGQTGVNKKALESYPILIPPLPEQQRIVAIVNKILKAIISAEENVETIRQNTRELFVSYVQSLFNKLYEDWEEKKLEEVCGFEKIPNRKQNLPYVGLEHIESNSGIFTGSKSPHTVKSLTFSFNANHVLYGRLRPYLNKVLLPNFEGHCSTEIFPIRPNDKIDKRFLYHWFLTNETVQNINATCTGTRMPRANMKAVLEFKLPIPSIIEQQRIVAKLDALSTETKKLEAIYQKKLTNLEELKKSILQKAFNGEL